eukprot:365584-Chlamydomonas_euryale.AAC.8
MHAMQCAPCMGHAVPCNATAIRRAAVAKHPTARARAEMSFYPPTICMRTPPRAWSATGA